MRRSGSHEQMEAGHLAGATGINVTVPPVIAPPGLPPLQFPVPPRSKPRREYTQPAYAEQFQCIGSACEDTCCQGWGVPIDQVTYEKYRSSPLLKPHIGTLIQLNTGHSTTSDYARINLTADAACPFLDPDKLCGVQKQLGAEMLSETCATYPRAVSTNAGQVERALNLSCPEATRLTILHPDLMGQAHRQLPARDHYAEVIQEGLPSRRRSKRAIATGPGSEPQMAIREFALLLLTDRSYPVWQRLYLLGLMTQRLTSLSAGTTAEEWADANPDAVARFLAESARSAKQFRLLAVMNEIKARPAEGLQIAAALLRLRISELPVAPRFVECVQAFELGLGCATAKSEAELLDAYNDGYTRYYRPLMDRHPHLIENYLANYVFKNNYPFERKSRHPLPEPEVSTDAEMEHLVLCVHLALAEALLIGMAAHYGEAFDLPHVIKLMQSLAKTIEHSKRFLDQIKVFVRERNLKNPRGIALLLRQAD